MEAQAKMGYALVVGVGTRIIPSPRPSEVQDLILAPFKWSHVDPLYKNSPHFRRGLKSKVFEYVEATEPPEDIDLSLNPDYDKDLDDAQRQFARHVCILDEVTEQMKKNLMLADQVNENGIAPKESKVTVAYLRERHRPMLLAIQDLEKRFKNRKPLLALLKKQLERIARLPS